MLVWRVPYFKSAQKLERNSAPAHCIPCQLLNLGTGEGGKKSGNCPKIASMGPQILELTMQSCVQHSSKACMNAYVTALHVCVTHVNNT